MIRISAEVRRAQLLQAALRVMARDGLAAGTTRAIVAEAGMALATFHYCFRSRNELLRELITLVTGLERAAFSSALEPAELLARNRTAIEPGLGPRLGPAAEDGFDAFREILRQALIGYLERLADNPGYMLFRLELNHYALRTPELRDLAGEQYRRYNESAERLLTVVAELSGMIWQVAPVALARLVVILIDGATTTWLVDHDTERTLAALEPVIDHLTTLVAPSTRSR